MADEDDFLDDEESSIGPEDSMLDGNNDVPPDVTTNPSAGQVPPLPTVGESSGVFHLMDISKSNLDFPENGSPVSPDLEDAEPVVDSDPPQIIKEGYQSEPSDSIEPVQSSDSFEFRYTQEQTLDLSGSPDAGASIPPDSGRQKPIPQQTPSLPTAGEKSSRQEDRANFGSMSYYKRKNIEKGRGDKIPGLEKGDDGKYRQAGNLNSGLERDEEGLRQQREFDMNSRSMPSGPLAVDLQPDIIPEIGRSGPSSFRPDGIDTGSMHNAVQDAADSVDTVTTGIIDVLARLTLNMRKANDNIRQLMDKLEVEDHRDEF